MPSATSFIAAETCKIILQHIPSRGRANTVNDRNVYRARHFSFVKYIHTFNLLSLFEKNNYKINQYNDTPRPGYLPTEGDVTDTRAPRVVLNELSFV